MNTHIRRLLLMLLFFVLANCVGMTPDPHLTTAEVIRLAEAEAKQHGPDYDPRRFERSEPAYYSARDNTWWVHYRPKPGSRLHYDFNISVDDRTKKSSLVLP